MDAEQELVEKVGEQLRAKIASKFQTSSFLAGLAVAVLGVQLSTLTQSTKPPLFAVSIALMFAAIVIYVAALIKLDELTMPKRFWEEDTTQSAQDWDWAFVLLADQDLWELRKRMIFFWYTLTLTATGITGLALLLLLVPQAWFPIGWEVGPGDTFVAAIAAVLVTVVYFLVLGKITQEADTIGQGQAKLPAPARKTLRAWLREWKFTPLLRLQD